MSLRTYCPKRGAEMPCLPVFRNSSKRDKSRPRSQHCCCQSSWREQGPGSTIDLHHHRVWARSLVDGRPAEWVQNWCRCHSKFGLQPNHTRRCRNQAGNFETAQWLKKYQVNHSSGWKNVRLMCLSHCLLSQTGVRLSPVSRKNVHYTSPVAGWGDDMSSCSFQVEAEH